LAFAPDGATGNDDDDDFILYILVIKIAESFINNEDEM